MNGAIFWLLFNRDLFTRFTIIFRTKILWMLRPYKMKPRSSKSGYLHYKSTYSVAVIDKDY